MIWLARRASYLLAPPLITVVLFPIVFFGCASAPRPATTVRIPVEQARAEFGALGVTTINVTPSISLGRPLTSPGQAAGRGAINGAVGPIAAGSAFGWGGAAAGVLIAPITTVVGAIYGAVAAKSPEQ